MRYKKSRELLKQYSRAAGKIRCDHRDENILKLMQKEERLQKSTGFPVFARVQIGMIGKFSLVWYVLWLILFIWGLSGTEMSFLGDHRSEILLSVMPPFLLLLTSGELSRVFSDSMIELEKTTKFSPEHVLMVHFLCMSVMHALMLLLGVMVIGHTQSLGMKELLIYGYTPMTLTTVVFLEMTRHLRGENLVMAAILAVTGVNCIIMVMGTDISRTLRSVDIYSADMLVLWEIALAVGVLLYVMEFWRLRKGVTEHGTGNKTGFEKI